MLKKLLICLSTKSMDIFLMSLSCDFEKILNKTRCRSSHTSWLYKCSVKVHNNVSTQGEDHGTVSQSQLATVRGRHQGSCSTANSVEQEVDYHCRGSSWGSRASGNYFPYVRYPSY